MNRSLPLAISFALAATLSACKRQDTEVRRYEEWTVRTANAMQASAPAPAGEDMSAMADAVTGGNLDLDWTTPGGWQEQGGSGMRLATFSVDGSECTITSFPGDVGGDEANVRRWLGQLRATATDQEIAGFAANPEALTTSGGLTGSVFDFRELVPDGAPMSMIAFITATGGQSVFVKWTGAPSVLAAHKEEFLALCRSLKQGQGN